MSYKVFINRLLALFISFSLGFSPLVYAEDQELLQAEDVKEIMAQILDQHVSQDRITPKIINQSFRVYIDQFDPDRIYLLNNEVEEFIEPSRDALQTYVQQYRYGDFSAYDKLEKRIQNAVERAQKLRTKVKKDKTKLFAEAKSHRPYRDRGEHSAREFSSSEEELEKRVQNDYVEFIEEQKVRYGAKKVASKKERILELYETDAKSHEESYLPYDERGRRLGPKQVEHRKTLHILKSLAKSLDSHTKFFDDAEAYDMRVRLEKGYEGTGIVFEEGLDGPIVVNMIKGSPAHKSGKIELDDLLVSVDGTSIVGLSYNQVMDHLRGKEGTEVKMTFKRGEETFRIDLKREKLTVEEDRVVTTYEKFGDGIVGTISLKSFYQNQNGISSESDVRAAIQYLRRQGPLRGLILDLRDNSGGYLSQAVKVAGLFITNGVVVISKYNDGEVRYYRDLDGKVFYDGPLVVLVSKGTASAAEIVAQALQDYGVALVVGDSRTYGKGSIQSQTVTDSGSTSFFKVTVGKYYTVSGRSPQVRGVEADIVVPSRVIYGQIGEEFLDYPLAQDTINPAYKDHLKDIHPEVKGWFLKYYVPTLQDKESFWKGRLDKLRSNSEYRVAHNRDYQYFFENPKAGTPNYILSSYQSKPLDVQHQEAISIIKDMFLMQSDLDSLHSASKK